MRLLRVPGFASLPAGQSVNAIDNWVAIIAIWGFAAFHFDAGAGDLALLFVVLSVPGALLGPLLGVPIDRLGPRRTLVLANVLGVLDAPDIAPTALHPRSRPRAHHVHQPVARAPGRHGVHPTHRHRPRPR